MRVAALIAMLVLLTACLPAAVLAQSAGDEQYVDPFQNAPNQSSGGGGQGGSGSNGAETPSGTQGGSTSGDTGTTAPSDGSAGATAGAGTTAGGDGVATGAGGLPRTGLALAPIGLLGLGLLVTGAALRRQVGLRRGT